LSLYISDFIIVLICWHYYYCTFFYEYVLYMVCIYICGMYLS